MRWDISNSGRSCCFIVCAIRQREFQSWSDWWNCGFRVGSGNQHAAESNTGSAAHADGRGNDLRADYRNQWHGRNWL